MNLRPTHLPPRSRTSLGCSRRRTPGLERMRQIPDSPLPKTPAKPDAAPAHDAGVPPEEMLAEQWRVRAAQDAKSKGAGKFQPSHMTSISVLDRRADLLMALNGAAVRRVLPRHLLEHLKEPSAITRHP